MIRVSVFTWIAVSIFVAALMFLPKPYNWLLWIPYGIALPPTIIRWNKRQMEIRNEERLNQGWAVIGYLHREK